MNAGARGVCLARCLLPGGCQTENLAPTPLGAKLKVFDFLGIGIGGRDENEVKWARAISEIF